MFRKKEIKVRKLLNDHAAKVAGTLTSMTETLNEYISGDFLAAKEHSFRTHTSESEADNIRRAIIEELRKGAFFPLMRADLINYLVLQDNIADQAEKICDFIICQKPEIPAEASEVLKKLCSRSIECFGSLKTAAGELSGNTGKLKSITGYIRSVEKETDKDEWHLTKNIFAGPFPLEKKLHLGELVRLITGITDLIEDAGDYLEALTIKMTV